MLYAVRQGVAPAVVFAAETRAAALPGRVCFGGTGDALQRSAPQPKKKKLNPILRLAAVAAFALVSMFGGVRGLPAASAASLPISQGTAITQVVEAPNYGYFLSQGEDVHINVPVVDSADDVPIPAEGSRQYVIEAADNPLVSPETHDYINQQLLAIHQTGYVGDVYVVIAPDIAGDAQALAQQINQRLNPGGDGAVILLNARQLRENHTNIRHDWTSVSMICTSNGKTTTCTPIIVHHTDYNIQDNMLEVTQGPNMFSDLAAQIERAGGHYDQADVQAQYDKIQQEMREHPEETTRQLAEYFARGIQSSRNDQAYTLYEGDYDAALRSMADTFARLYQDPVYQYLQHRADQQHLQEILIKVGIGLGGATAVGGAAYVIKRKLDGY